MRPVFIVEIFHMFLAVFPRLFRCSSPRAHTALWIQENSFIVKNTFHLKNPPCAKEDLDARFYDAVLFSCYKFFFCLCISAPDMNTIGFHARSAPQYPVCNYLPSFSLCGNSLTFSDQHCIQKKHSVFAQFSRHP